MSLYWFDESFRCDERGTIAFDSKPLSRVFQTIHSTLRMLLIAVVFAGGIICMSLENEALAAESKQSSRTPTIDVLDAQSQGLVSVRYIPNSSKSAQVIVTNKTKRPLSLRLPASFAGIPVLAQGMGGMGGMGGGQQGGGGFGGGGIGGGQAAGGGGGGMGGQGMNGMGGGGQQGGGGMGAFSIPPEKFLVIKVRTVCLEYGKPEPQPRMPYKLVEAESFSSDPRLLSLLESLGRGEMSQKVAQAAAWHISSGLTWEQLAAEKIDHVGVPDEAYFSRVELAAAHRVVEIITTRANNKKAPSSAQSASVSAAP